MKYLIILAAAALAGCATTSGFNNTEVLVQKEYVVRTAPDSLKTLPPLPPALANPKTASNSMIAQFMNNTEEYVANLEAMIQTLVNFYEKPVTNTEAGQMRVVTPMAQPTPNPARVIQPQTVATPVPANTAARPATTAASTPAPTGFTTPLQRARATQ